MRYFHCHLFLFFLFFVLFVSSLFLPFTLK